MKAGNVHHFIGLNGSGAHAVRNLGGQAETSAGREAMLLHRLFCLQGINRNTADGIFFLLDQSFQLARSPAS